MSWLNVWDGIKKKTCRFFLQRYLGQFLEEKLNLEQLNVDLYNGKATLRNVSLKVDAINDLFESQGWTVEVVSGRVGTLTVSVPWNALMTSDSCIEVSDLSVTLRPVKRQNVGTSMIESMWSSVSSSMQLAEECMKLSDSVDGPMEVQSSAIAGLEKFAETIDNVLNRIKAKFNEINIRMESLPKAGNRGIAIVVDVGELNYRNETGGDTQVHDDVRHAEEAHMKSADGGGHGEAFHCLPTFAKHNIALSGLQIYTEEFVLPSFSKTERIPIIEVKEQQLINIKVKQSEEISGPKISLFAELGSIYAFLTPRQVHVLIMFWYAFFDDEQPHNYRATVEESDDDCPKDEVLTRRSCMTGVVGNAGNWVSDFDSDAAAPPAPMDDLYYLTTAGNIPSYSDSMSSSFSSNTTIGGGASKLHRRLMNRESYGEIMNFDVKVAAIVAVVLHRDILVEEECAACEDRARRPLLMLTEESQAEMILMANKFFEAIQQHPSESANRRTALQCLCTKNHIYIRIVLLTIEGAQERYNSFLSLKCSLNAANLDFCEVISSRVERVLTFHTQEVSFEGHSKRPDVSITITSTSCTTKDVHSTKVNISLDKCTVELDVSFYDRLSYILGPSPFVTAHTQKAKKNMFATSKRREPQNLIQIDSDNLHVNLRFPIHDARPFNDPNRVPWWQQNVRSDFLLLIFDKFVLKFNDNNIEIYGYEINGFYCPDGKPEARVHFLRTMGPRGVDAITPPQNPKIILTIPTADSETMCTIESDASADPKLPFSSKYVCRQSDTLHNKRDAAESDAIFLPGDSAEIKKFSDATLKCAKLKISVDLPIVYANFESKQLYEIIFNRLNADLFMWEPYTPVVVKSSYNIGSPLQQSLFNINLTDSIYIPPMASTPVNKALDDLQLGASHISNMVDSSIYDDSEYDVKINRNSGRGYTSLSESIYFSTHQHQEYTNPPVPTQKPCDCAVSITIRRGYLKLLAPIRDTENHVIPGQLGRFDVNVQLLDIFCANGCKNNENLGYVCIQAKDVEAYHCGLVPVNDVIALNSTIPEHVQALFYKVPKGLTKGDCMESDNREMLSVIIETKKLPEQRIKRLKVATGIQRGTLRFNPTVASYTWLNQLIDFLDITDYPIEGYTPYGIITEIQVHLWDCAVDYRPKNFPYRAVLEVGSFTVSKNMISAAHGDSSRFIAEECVLSIAPINNDESEPMDHIISSIPADSLVPVLDIGLFDMSLRLCEKLSEKCPQFDLRCSVHDAHMRTCHDSASALAQLIAHIANDGDIIASSSETCESTTTSSTSFQSSVASSTNVDIFTSNDDKATTPLVSVLQQERVNLLMAEAVRDVVTLPTDRSAFDGCNDPLRTPTGRTVDVYYFPDENKVNCDIKQTMLPTAAAETGERISDSEEAAARELYDILSFESNVMLHSYLNKSDDDEPEAADPLPQVKADLGEPQRCNASVPEDDYCIIANEEKGFLHQCGIGSLKLSDDPLRIVDNHFCLPSCKPDLLKPPEHFPMPTHRYTLCEMTFTWHLYGGRDFANTVVTNAANERERERKPEPSKMSEAYKHGVSYSKGTKAIQFGTKPKEKMTWKTTGGYQRDHEILVEIQLLKIRFTHELYPKHTSQASRQVLLVSDIEIRDCLQTSDIKKFLYHPKKSGISNQSAHHMIVVKALHVRPNPQKSAIQECSLRISLLPMRLHIDQDTLVFLVDFFTNLGTSCGPESAHADHEAAMAKHQPPVMNVDEVPEAMQDLQARKLVTTNLELLMDAGGLNDKHTDNESAAMAADSGETSESLPIYFREVIFSPDVPICFDYHGRRIELSRGPVAGLLMGLGQLECSEIRLRKLVCRRGMLGVEKLVTYLCKEWLNDIKRNQLPKIIGGIGPTYAFVQLFQGIYDLFWLPIEQYQKDGRIIKGIQLGAQSFTARTALAALELTSRIIYLLQFTAETAFDIVSPGPSVKKLKKGKHGKKKRPLRPRDLREGVTNAYYIVKEGINDSANTLIETARSEHDQKGYSGAVGAVVRQIPQLVVCPAVLATQATTNILGGVKNSLVPGAKIEAHEKWKSDCE